MLKKDEKKKKTHVLLFHFILNLTYLLDIVLFIGS